MKNIHFEGPLLAVSDIKKAKAFYIDVMEQKIKFDSWGSNVIFESGITLQSEYAGLIACGKEFALKPTGVCLEIKAKPNNFELYFVVKNLDYWVAKIKSTEGIELLHDVTEYLWGQRVFRFYDHDKHIIEVAENMETVAKRFLAQGLTVEEIAERFRDPVEYVQQLLDTE
jgi:catechol 2,3-dioxygenase-like lactoylglutathione lyase family enzyme